MIDYPTNLTDKQWKVIKNIVEIKKRKRKHSIRNMINAMMYITKTGCQWRQIKFFKYISELMHLIQNTPTLILAIINQIFLSMHK